MLLLFLMHAFSIYIINASETASLSVHPNAKILAYKNLGKFQKNLLKDQICLLSLECQNSKIFFTCTRCQLQNLNLASIAQSEHVLFTPMQEGNFEIDATSSSSNNDLIFKSYCHYGKGNGFNALNINLANGVLKTYDTGRIVQAHSLFIDPDNATSMYALFFNQTENPQFKKLQIRKYVLDKDLNIEESKAIFKLKAQNLEIASEKYSAMQYEGFGLDSLNHLIYFIYYNNNIPYKFMYHTKSEQCKTVSYNSAINVVQYFSGREIRKTFIDSTKYLLMVHEATGNLLASHAINFDPSKRLSISPNGKMGVVMATSGKIILLDLCKLLVIGISQPFTLQQNDRIDTSFFGNDYVWFIINDHNYVIDIKALQELI